MPCVLFFWAYLAFMLTKKPVQKLLGMLYFKIIFEFNDDEPEDLTPFFDNLDKSDLTSTTKKEDMVRKTYNYALKTDQSYNNYKKAMTSKAGLEKSQVRDQWCIIQGIHSYNLLRNPEYTKAFQYGKLY